MSLPFLNAQRLAGGIAARRNKSDLSVKQEVESPTNEPKNHELEIACEDFLRAIYDRSISSMMKAAIDMHKAVDMMPHAEGEHTNEGEE